MDHFRVEAVQVTREGGVLLDHTSAVMSLIQLLQRKIQLQSRAQRPQLHSLCKRKFPKKILSRKSIIQLPTYSSKKMRQSSSSQHSETIWLAHIGRNTFPLQLDILKENDFLILINICVLELQASRLSEEIKSNNGKEPVIEMESPSRASVGTSIEVQTGNSVEFLSVKLENAAGHHRMPKKARTQVLKIKEDWDDSTVSSNITKMRIQNRMEATNRRERALAYAFAQQLRICSKRKQTRSDDTEPNMGWSWLERWMATRLSECSVESRTSKPYEPQSCSHRVPARKRFFDVAEEMESCGSNEVSLQFDSLSMTSANHNDGLTTTRNRLKSTRTISRRKTAPSNQCLKVHSKIIKKECQKESERNKENSNKKEINCKDASS
ncbi:protein IQ-DOMAIN 33 isoform X2 [Hevea brasiliensis]|uniref:protein IQ-DOMAIN 33 isoform X2 n=1 Tax=Hevea brasiliensis TaxID=3981 RepID=UPI0025E91CF3|nr:protein IQ-DOMAIN 33 isoform X2 [Hevea brasiliensis]